jgi:nucleoside 2-deoxyribosyltransferase
MNIYFSCSLTGGREDERIYGLMVDHLLAKGHEVSTAQLARPEAMEDEKIVAPHVVYQRDIKWLKECDMVIAEVSTPSHGVGYEVAFGLGMGKPVLCCYREGVAVSKMILGNDSPSLELGTYTDSKEAVELLDSFLNQFGKNLSTD